MAGDFADLTHWSLVGVAGHNCRPPAIASLEGRRFEIEPQAALGLLARVAGIAVLFQQRANVMHKVGRCGAGCGTMQADDQDAGEATRHGYSRGLCGR